jgi:hypothetical protein
MKTKATLITTTTGPCDSMAALSVTPLNAVTGAGTVSVSFGSVGTEPVEGDVVRRAVRVRAEAETEEAWVVSGVEVLVNEEVADDTRTEPDLGIVTTGGKMMSACRPEYTRPSWYKGTTNRRTDDRRVLCVKYPYFPQILL